MLYAINNGPWPLPGERDEKGLLLFIYLIIYVHTVSWTRKIIQQLGTKAQLISSEISSSRPVMGELE